MYVDKYYNTVFTGTTDIPETKTNEEALRSLLVITGSPPSNPKYEEFKRKVNKYDDLPPFSFPNPFGSQRKVSETTNTSHIHIYYTNKNRKVLSSLFVEI